MAKTTSAKTRSNAARVRGQRGAVMVEALIIASMFIIGLMGLMFFKNLYVAQLHTLRTARAAIIAHGMGACDANYPSEWIGPDAGRFGAEEPDRASEVADGSSEEVNASAAPPDTGADSRADSFQFDQLSSDGSGFMNEIVGNEFNGRVAVGAGAETPNGQRFEADVRATAFVSCGDPVQYQTGYGEALGRVVDIMGDLLSFDIF